MDNHLYAVDISTGLVAWSHPAELVSAAPTVAAGIICAAGSLGDIYAFKAASGTLAWQAKTTPATLFQRTWAVAGRKVIIGTDMGALQVRDAATGAPGRTFTTSGIFNGTAADATRLWTYATESAGTLGPAVAGGQVFVVSGLSVQSIDARTGKPGWSFSLTGTTFFSSPTVADGLLFIGSQDNNIYAVRA